jgi:hypothetical protein
MARHGLFHKIRPTKLTKNTTTNLEWSFSPTTGDELSKLVEFGLDGLYSEVGTFNEHPVYSNGKTKWIYMDPSIDTQFTEPGWYLFDESGYIDTTNIFDASTQLSDLLVIEE